MVSTDGAGTASSIPLGRWNMMANRKLLIAFLCPLFVVASVMLIQGCGGGSQTEEAAEAAKEVATDVAKDVVDKSKAALEEHTQDIELAGYACTMCPAEVSLAPGKCGKCGMDLEKAKVHYTCSHCGGSELKPGKCACGMDLVLQVAAEGEKAESTH
jgi:hypothetical protein